jgi:hypothetical protein
VIQEEKERRRAELTARAKEEAKRRFDLSALGDDADELLDGYELERKEGGRN